MLPAQLLGALAARHQGWTASNVDAASAKMLTDVCVCVCVCVCVSCLCVCVCASCLCVCVWVGIPECVRASRCLSARVCVRRRVRACVPEFQRPVTRPKTPEFHSRTGWLG